MQLQKLREQYEYSECHADRTTTQEELGGTLRTMLGSELRVSTLVCVNSSRLTVIAIIDVDTMSVIEAL